MTLPSAAVLNLPRGLRASTLELVHRIESEAYEAGVKDGEKAATKRFVGVVGQDQRPRIVEIQQAVANHFGTALSDMTSKRRARQVARPRQVAMYLCRHLTLLSLPQIARHFGGRDHTTVMHAIAVVERLSTTDATIAEAVAAVQAKFDKRAA